MNIELFKPYKKQREFIDKFGDTKDMFGVVVAPRGSGKTLLGINLLLYWVLSTKKQKGGWVSPVYSQAKSVYDIITASAKDLIVSANRMEMILTFVNGSTIKFLSSDNQDTIRGFRFTHVVLDEVAFMKERAIDQAILPTLNPNGKKCLMISTPKGKNHLFGWYNREDVISDRFPLTECPYVKDELIQAAKQSLPPDLFRQEFLAEFVDSSNDVFTGIDNVSTVREYTPGSGQDAYIGIDTGLTSDMSVLAVVSPMGRVLHIESTNNENINTIATRFSNIMSTYNIVGGYIEKNGIGAAMYDLVGPKFKRVKPFVTTQDSKADAVRKLIQDIETMAVELPTMDLCPELHTEFSQFTYKMSSTGKLSFGHIAGGHDDMIDALLMANYSRVKFMERRPIRVSGIKSVKPSFGGPK